MADPIIALLASLPAAGIVYFLMDQQNKSVEKQNVLLLERIDKLEARVVTLTDQLMLVPQGSEYQIWSGKIVRKEPEDQDHA